MKKKLSPNKRKNRIINDLINHRDRLLYWDEMLSNSNLEQYREIRELKEQFNPLKNECELLRKQNQELLEYKAKYYNLIKSIKI